MAISVSEVKVRSVIRMGDSGGFCLETPYVKSFNIKRTRGQMSATFSATLKVKHSQLSVNRTNLLGNKFEIWAGTVDNNQAQIQENRLNEMFTARETYLMSVLPKVFTGYVLKVVFNPCRDDAEFIFLNVSGKDVLYVLENKKFTRRVKAESLAMWGAITSVVRSRTNFDTKFNEIEPDKPIINHDNVLWNGVPVRAGYLNVPEATPIGDAGGFLVTPAEE